MSHYDVVVIGGGPGGYVCAIRAAQLGLKTACIDKEPMLGGTCLRVGCIPSKALLESSELYHLARHGLALHGVKVPGVELDLDAMMKRKDRIVSQLGRGIQSLFQKHGVTRYQGHGRIEGRGKVSVDGKEMLEAKHIVIATGSVPSSLKGVEMDRDRIGTSTEALAYPEVPRHLVVIGAGVIGLELGSVWLRLGSEVTVLEYFDRILPGFDAEIAEAARKIFQKQGFRFRLGVRVESARVENGRCRVEGEGFDPVECDRVLVAVGRKPNLADLGLETVGIETDGQGRIPVDKHYRTKAEGIYAIGDATPGPMLAHRAEDEGIACAEQIAWGHCHVNYDAIPSVIYTHPEIASVGRSQEALEEAGVAFRKGTFPFRANGRAHTLNATEGLVKVLADAETDRILGVHILGPRAGDLIAEVAVAVEFAASSEDIARSVHAHPTLAEAVREAALAVDNRALHI